MNKKLLSILLSLMGMAVVVTLFSCTVNAAENQNGGQVTTEGIITFYENESSKLKPTSPTEPKASKPKGRLPYTGELAAGTLIGSGVALFALVFFFKKRQKEKEAEK